MDGSVDLKGRPALRSKTGRWKACYFLVGYQMFESMAFYGIVSNLVIYLTTQLHEGTLNSSKNVNNWSGAIWITPILGAYVADTHWGRYKTFAVFLCIYILGMIMLTLAVSLPSLKPPDHCNSDSNVCEKASKFQVGFFYAALYVLAVGTGGTNPNISTMGGDQFDEFNPEEKHQKVSLFNWWLFSAFIGTLIGQTFLVYIQENVGFSLGYAIPTAGLIISSAIFFMGTPFYRHKVQKGNPFGRMAQVVVATARKWRVNVPSDPTQLHEVNTEEYVAEGRLPINHTPSLRFLDKAATKDGSTSPWKLCSVTQVEETKVMIKLLPIWISLFMPCAVIAQVNTLFVKQGTTLNRHIGSHFQILPGSVTALVTISLLVFLVVYDRIIVKIFRRITGNPRGITILQRIGIGLGIHVLVMVVASITEIQRIRVVKAHGLQGNEKAVAPQSIFILLPQYLLMGIAEAFLEVGKLEFFYDQAPESMQSIGNALLASTLGIGNFLSSFLLTVVTKITGRKGHVNWILDNLNASRLYYYYALLAVLNVLNLVFFLVVSGFYVYKRETNEAFGNHGHGHVGAVTVEFSALPLDTKAAAYETEPSPSNSTEMVMLSSEGK